MNRAQFEHAVRAAAAVAAEHEVIVIGSQAIHAWIKEEIPEAAMRSVEADIALRRDVDGRKADLIDGSIGEASLFQETFGFYAHGVSVTTALLPCGWEQRLVRFATPATAGVVAWCLSPEDLWVSKALAVREAEGLRTVPGSPPQGRGTAGHAGGADRGNRSAHCSEARSPGAAGRVARQEAGLAVGTAGRVRCTSDG